MRTFRAWNVEVRPTPIVVLCLLGTFCVIPDGGVQDPVAKDRRACRTRAYRDDLRMVQVLNSWADGCSVLDRESLPLTSTPEDWLSLIDLLSPNGLRCWRGGYAAPGPGERLSRCQRMVNATPRGCGKDNGWNKKRRLLDSSKRLNTNAQAGGDQHRRVIQLAPK